MQLPEIAVNLLVFNQIPLAQALDAVRDAGHCCPVNFF